ncbi:cyclic nucleotide-binding and patatin-like phospholipase domain-containing protein [Jiulongibacter sp. NS-SX5]|uniref:cyclic nucleotide-binding and patatin-like phospholipase domain-containing protein n=1 Tax=Jiulongibacter sp. NS-SX5 TaxID=3463854 RepID=UPI0040587FCB
MKTTLLNDSGLSSESIQLASGFVQKYFGEGISEEVGQLEYLKIKKGDMLFHQNDEADGMYILIGGKLLALVNEPRRIVGEVNIGECVGETALLNDSKRTASIMAARDSSLVKVSKKKFESLWKANPEIILKLSQTIIKRLDKQNKGVSERQNACKIVSLIGVGMDRQYRLANFIEEYWEGKLNVLTIKEGEADSELLDLKISEAEQNFDLVLLLSSDNWSWNKKIVNHSDEVCYIAQESQLDGYREYVLHNDFYQGRLILIYQPNESPKDVDRWIGEFETNKIHRCRVSSSEDAGRIARILADRAICWVFGGGGAHGFAHLGSLKALQEKGVPVDIVGGTSIGSIIAGCLAQDWSLEDTLQKVRKDISEKSPLNDFTFPLISLLRGQKMQKVNERHFGVRIENTWKNFFCVASNLSSYQPEVLQTGKMDRAISSSISIPGILPPLLYNQSLLVDGGVLNNLPTDVMKTLYRGFVISVDLNGNKVRKIEEEYRISNLQLIKNWFTKERKYVPSLMNVIMKSMTLASVADSASKKAISDLYINPNIKKGFLEWKAMDSIFQQGYEESLTVLEHSDFMQRAGL